MRIALAFVVASLLIVPGVLADDSVTPLHEGCEEGPGHDECHEDQDAPGFGLVAAVGALGALAFVARRRA